MSRRRFMNAEDSRDILAVDANTVLMLRFNESLTKDDAGKQTVSVVGAPSQVKGLTGKAFYTNHLSNYLSMNRTVFTNLVASKNFTIECFVKYDSHPQSVICGLDNGSSTNCYIICIGESSMKRVIWGGYVNSPTSDAYTIAVNAEIPPETWHHLAVTCDNGYYRLFLNGKMIASRPSMSLYQPNVPFTIGGRATNMGGNSTYIDEFRMSNIARYKADFTPPTL